jgi:hypothetical protein
MTTFYLEKGNLKENNTKKKKKKNGKEKKRGGERIRTEG